MHRTTLNLVTDAFFFVIMLASAATGLMIHYILPPRSGGAGRGAGLTLWGWNRHDWGDLHLYLGFALLALLVVHVTLHWHWLTVTAGRLFSMPRSTVPAPTAFTRYAAVAFVSFVIACFAGLLWTASAGVERRSGADSSARQGWTKPSDTRRADAGRSLRDRSSRVSAGDGWHGGRLHPPRESH
jgi:hypothetical protein